MPRARTATQRQAKARVVTASTKQKTAGVAKPSAKGKAKKATLPATAPKPTTDASVQPTTHDVQTDCIGAPPPCPEHVRKARNKRHKTPKGSISTQIKRVLAKHVSQEAGLATPTLIVLDSICADLTERLLLAAHRLMSAAKSPKITLQVDTIRNAAGIVLPNNMLQSALEAAADAVGSFNKAMLHRQEL